MGFADAIFTVVVAVMLIPIPFVAVGGSGAEGSEAASGEADAGGAGGAVASE